MALRRLTCAIIFVFINVNVSVASVKQCYYCEPDASQGRRCDNAYQYGVDNCPDYANFACISVHTDDHGIKRSCTEEQRCMMFPLFETGECCFSDFCNTKHTFKSTKNFYLIAFIQFGFPALNICLAIIGVILTIRSDRIERKKQERQETIIIMPHPPSPRPQHKASVDVFENALYVRPSTPWHHSQKKSKTATPVMTKNVSPPLKFHLQPHYAPTTPQPNVGSSGSESDSSALNSLMTYERDDSRVKLLEPLSTDSERFESLV